MPTTPARLPRRTEDPRQIVVIGAGYVGLVTAACLAAIGHRVECIDGDQDRVGRLRAGILPIREPGLDHLVNRCTADGSLRFGTDLARATAGADVAIIAVGTLDGTGRWTDAHVAAVIDQLLALPDVPRLLVVRSTLRPGRMAGLQERIAASGRPTTLLLNPEFTRESTAVADFLAPDRIVIGIPTGADETVAEPLRAVYAPLDAPTLVVDHASAELIKIGSNAFLAIKITFANELARLCRELGGDAASVRAGIGMDARIGEAFLRAGPGFGGSCLPSQVDLLTDVSRALDLDLELIPAAQRANRAQPGRIADEVLALTGAGARIAVLGLAFKAGTDDVRSSPALALIAALRERGITDIAAFDPGVRALPGRTNLSIAPSPYAAAEGADLVIIATEWPLFARLDWARMAAATRHREVYDARGIVDAEAASAAGFRVHSIERAPFAASAATQDSVEAVA
jgi:UDPglucose 6-dehydrogenase